MKTRVTKIVLLTGMLCTVSTGICACRGEKAVTDANAQQSQMGEPIAQDDVSVPQPPALNLPADETFASEDSGRDDMPNEQPSAEDLSDTWDESSPDLEGDIKELKDGQFTLIEAIQEEVENGAAMAVPASGSDDIDFHKTPVTYDDNTLFAIKTIYDGGERYEITETTAAELASGQFVEIWGSILEDKVKAKQIRIVKVAGIAE